ncbi:MAG: DUF2516 family protein [Actinomycetota bacterium]|nr:DUF2516 family protein [Actinomycetota bacterium]
MDVVAELYRWTDQVLFWGLVALRAWALVDCLIRKVAAFPAVDKLSKPAWVAMLLLGGLFGSLISPLAPIGPISLISAVLACVYLADVRPAVREVSGGTGR